MRKTFLTLLTFTSAHKKHMVTDRIFCAATIACITQMFLLAVLKGAFYYQPRLLLTIFLQCKQEISNCK